MHEKYRKTDHNVCGKFKQQQVIMFNFAKIRAGRDVE